jgi:hypothetical protein
MSGATYTTQNDLLMNNLMDFYNKDGNLEKMLKIITGESKISLRIVDWFATNYAKKNFTLYNIEDQNGYIRRFKVYVDYKLKLKAYSKQRFDPFCRWKRIRFNNMDTTVGQLNFFEWALSDQILSYLEANREAVHADMESRLQELKDGDEKPETRRRRHELSHSATKSLARHDVSVKVSFD